MHGQAISQSQLLGTGDPGKALAVVGIPMLFLPLRPIAGSTATWGATLSSGRAWPATDFSGVAGYSLSGKPRARVPRGDLQPLESRQFQYAQSDCFHDLRCFRHGRSRHEHLHHLAAGAIGAKTSLVGGSLSPGFGGCRAPQHFCSRGRKGHLPEVFLRLKKLERHDGLSVAA